MDYVYNWALNTVGISQGNANVLLTEEITGDTLPDLTKEDLRAWGMSGGAAIKTIKAIQSLTGRLHIL